MSFIKRAKEQADWEKSVARCGTCIHFRGPKQYMRDSLPKLSNPLCTKEHFTTSINAVCRYWESEFGERLDGGPTQKGPTKPKCPLCGNRVSYEGMADHLVDVHKAIKAKGVSV